MNGVEAGIAVNDYCGKQYHWRVYGSIEAALWKFSVYWIAFNSSFPSDQRV